MNTIKLATGFDAEFEFESGDVEDDGDVEVDVDAESSMICLSATF